LLVLIIVLFLFFSAFFSGLEIAFLSASKLKVELKKNQPGINGRIVGGFMENPKLFLATTLIGNNISLVVFSYLLSKFLHPLLLPHIPSEFLMGLTIIIFSTMVVLIFGEYLPKTLFRLFADRVLYTFAIPLNVFTYLFYIPTKIMVYASEILMKLFVKQGENALNENFTRVDLEHFIEMTQQGEMREEIDKDLFSNALNLNQLKVKDCMIPRTEIVSISEESPLDELIALFNSSNLSRIIVVGEDLDDVLGYVHHQQMLKNPENIRSMVMEIPYIPEVMSIHDLLNRFTLEKNSVAIVVDEFGGTSGLITMEDVLEELFGDIEDEHDEEEFLLEQVSDREFLISGRVEVSEINETFPHLKIPEGDYHTLSGYIVITTQRIPEFGEEITLDGKVYVIESVSETKIETVRVLMI
jgi:putative hemolysin